MPMSVSIIVPAYNAGERIEKCLDALINQTLENIEIIVIDDGSTDCTAEICSAFATKDGRVRHVEQSNSGVSAARNTGLALARGEYVTFCDADDFLEPEALATMLSAAQRFESDIVVCKIRQVGANAEVREVSNIQASEETVYEREESIRNWLVPLFGIGGKLVRGFATSCLIRGNLLRAHGIAFDTSVSVHEDALFIAWVLAFAERVVFVPRALYNYIYKTGSLTSIYFAERRVSYPRRLAELTRYREALFNIACMANLGDSKSVCVAHCYASYLYYLSSSAATSQDSVSGAVRVIGAALRRRPASMRMSDFFLLAGLDTRRRIVVFLANFRMTFALYMLGRVKPPSLDF